jgi:hypothetical protein
MSTVHLIYPHGPRVSAPDAIGRNLGRCLERRYAVRYYDWDERRTLRPALGDVLLGHPHPAPWTIFRRSAAHPGWRRVLALAPYQHGDPALTAFLEAVIDRADLYLAITGNYWFETMGRSPFAHWQPKTVHVDLAVDRRDFPPLKTSFAPPGQRRLVYIGSAGRSARTRSKNTGYLQAIAAALPEHPIAWIGSSWRGLPGLVPLGYQGFATESGRATVAGGDFLITVGYGDANPTTILEAMAWGLIPVCTPQSGYHGYRGIVNLPLDDVTGAVRVLRELQQAPEAVLREWQASNWQLLDGHFNWDRFGRQVMDAIESDARPALLPRTRRQRLAMRWLALTSPVAPWRPINLIGAQVYRGLRRLGWRKGQR